MKTIRLIKFLIDKTHFDYQGNEADAQDSISSIKSFKFIRPEAA